MGDEIFCRKCFWMRLLAVALWAAIILFFSLAPQPPRPTVPLLAWDKLQHAGSYALLTALAARFFRQWRPASRSPWGTALTAAVVFGAVIEILQGTLTASRNADWRDLLANGTGAALAALLSRSARWGGRGPSEEGRR